MTTKRAIELLQLLRHSTEAAQGCTGQALDMAIGVMKLNVIHTDIESIIKSVERETRVSEEQMCKKGRHREFCEARAIVAYMARHYAKMTYTSIGERLNRDHVMAIHYDHTVSAWLDEPRLNLDGARLVTKLIRELEADDKTGEGSTHGVQQVAQA